MAFARSMSACGLRVLTPELPDSRDYRIQPSDVQAIGDSVQWLQNTTGRPVGLMGLSFSGGLALMAAAKLPFSNEISFVFSVGAHDDLLRVATFYATEADPLPDGDVERAKPNNYGPWVLEYEHLEDFVPEADVAAIRPVLRARLYENLALEKQLLANLTDEQKPSMRIFSTRRKWMPHYLPPTKSMRRKWLLCLPRATCRAAGAGISAAWAWGHADSLCGGGMAGGGFAARNPEGVADHSPDCACQYQHGQAEHLG